MSLAHERRRMTDRRLRVAFFVIAAMFAFTACFHLAAVVRPSVDPEAPAWRHLLFACINGSCIAGLLKRPIWFLPPFAALLVQQVVSHGGHALEAWTRDRIIDWPSLAVLVVMPATFVLLIVDARARRERYARSA
jgi:hypothetical protein